MGRRSLVGMLVALAFALVPARSNAQSASELALARQWFRDAEIAEKNHDYKGALEKFEKALSVKNTPQILVRVGVCHEKLGQLVAAIAAYQQALEKANAAGLSDVVSVAKDQLEALRSRVPTVTIVVADGSRDATVTMDGTTLTAAVLGDKLPLDPGEHKVAATAPGRRSFEQAFRLAEGETRQLSVDLGPQPQVAAPPPPPPPAKEAAQQSSMVPAYVLIGGGVVAIGAGVVLFVVAAGKDGSIDDLCGGSDRPVCPKSREDEIRSDISTVDTLRAFSFIAGGVGIASAAIGTGLLITSSKKPRTQNALRVVSTPGGIAASGRF